LKVIHSPIRLETAIPLLLQRLSKLEDHSDVSIAFPDEGAWKRFQSLFTGYELITCIKVRKETKRVVTIKDGDPRGKHVVIVDDLVQSGGTLQECSKVETVVLKGCISQSMHDTIVLEDASLNTLGCYIREMRLSRQ
jgi:phosphoribosylpyrophosphate synthetase